MAGYFGDVIPHLVDLIDKVSLEFTLETGKCYTIIEYDNKEALICQS
jgi:hypothetical protein